MKLQILCVLLFATQSIHCIALNLNEKLSGLLVKKTYQDFDGLTINKRQANPVQSFTMQPDVEWITVLPTIQSQKQREHSGLKTVFDNIFAVIIF